MTRYKAIFEKVIDEIKEDKKIKFLHTNFADPATPDLLEKASMLFSKGHESDIIKFYSEMNGLQVIWNYEEGVSKEICINPLSFLSKEILFDGVINFLPLEIFLNQDTWKNTIWFENDKYTEVDFLGELISIAKIRKKILPFDFFSTDMSMAIYTTKIDDYVFLLQDYHIDYTNSLITYFDDYINFIQKTKGLVKSRYNMFNVLNGYRKPFIKKDQLIP